MREGDCIDLNRAFHQVIHFAGARGFGETQASDRPQMQKPPNALSPPLFDSDLADRSRVE